MHTQPPIFSRESLVEAILRYDKEGLAILAALATLSGFMSGLGYVSGTDDPTLSTYLAGAVFGFAVALIAHGYWKGAWMLPEHIMRNYFGVYFAVAIIGFGAFGTVSYFGNQKFVASDISRALAEEDRINAIATGAQNIVSFVGQIGPIEAELAERAAQAERFAEAEASGSGPSGVGGRGPIFFGFTASGEAYANARSLLVGRVAQFEALKVKINDAVARLREAQIDNRLSSGERRQKLKTLEGEALSLLREALALDPAGSIAAAAELVGKGVPTPSLSSSASSARIGEINAEMKGYAEAARAKAAAIGKTVPALPELKSQSQEEHLLANALRFPALSLTALLVDACGFIILGFRFAAYASLRARDQREDALTYDVYVTPRDFARVIEMAEEARNAKAKLLDPPKPRGRPRGSKNKVKGEEGDD